jgi:16S rRNA processing protein RimM
MIPDLNPNPNTGSSKDNEPVFVVIGKFRKPHGIRGEIRMTVLTDFPELLDVGQRIYVDPDYQPYQIKSIRWHGGDMLIALEELPDRTAVEIFRNTMVYMKSQDIPAPAEGEFYHHQLVGLEIVTDEGEKLGLLKEVILTGANDVFLVDTPDGKEILLPDTEEVVLNIDLDNRSMLVHIIPGLLD